MTSPDAPSRALAISRAALVTAAVLVLASCGGTTEEESDSVAVLHPPSPVTAPEVMAEYEAAADVFGAEFPDDVELPSLSDRIEGLVSKGPGGPVSFEEGYGESELVTVWRCAWQRAYLNAEESGDEKGKARAADELTRRYYRLPAVKKWVRDPERAFDREVIQPAIAGDFGPLKNDLKINCGKPFTP